MSRKLFINLYRKGIINEKILFILLPRKDAEAIVLGTKVCKDAAKIAKNYDY